MNKRKLLDMMHLGRPQGGSTVQTHSMWNDSQAVGNATDDNTTVNIGVRFYSDVAGRVTHIRYYRPTGSTGAHDVYLYDATTQALLGSGTNTGTTYDAWQEVALETPVAIEAGKDYVAVVYVSGFYVATGDFFFEQSYSAGPLHFPASVPGRFNGMYLYGAQTFPTDTWNETNYWVDVVLEVGEDTAAPNRGIPASGGGGGASKPQAWVSATSSPGTSSTSVTWTVHLDQAQTTDLSVQVYHSRVSDGVSQSYTWLIPAGNASWSGTYAYQHANMQNGQTQVVFGLDPGTGYTLPNSAQRPRHTSQALGATGGGGGGGTQPTTGVLYLEDFEDGTAFDGIKRQIGTSYGLTVVDDPVNQHGRVARWELHDTDPDDTSGGTRAEVLFPEDTALAEGWYSFRGYFPSAEFQEDTDNEAINQWHQSTGGTPITSLNSRVGRWYMRQNGEPNEEKDLGPMLYDQWVDFVIYLKQHFTAGAVKVWVNGELKADYTGKTMHDVPELGRWKIGLYKSDWNGTQQTDTTKRVWYCDQVRRGDATATLESMTPTWASSGGSTVARAVPDPTALTYPDAPLVLSNADIVGGQILIENKRIQVTEGTSHCIDARGVTTRCTIVVRDCVLRGPGMLVFGEYARHDWVIENNFFFGRRDLANNKPGWGRWGVRITNPYSAFIEHNYFSDGGGVRIEYTGGVSGMGGHKQRYNKVVNVYQPDGLLNAFSVVATSTHEAVPEQEIAWNEVYNDVATCWVEDTINIYAVRAPSSSPGMIHNNFLSGAFKGKTATSYTGGGIILDGTDRAVEHFVVEDNIGVRQANYVFSIACGINCTLRRNRFAVAAEFGDGTPYASWTSGIWTDDYSDDLQLATGNQVYDNHGGVVSQSGGRQDYGFYDSYDGVADHTTATNNTSIAESVTRATEDALEDEWEARKLAAGVICGPVDPA